MALRNVFLALAEKLGPEVPVVGPEDKHRFDRFPRIAWEPMKGRQMPAQRIGGGAHDDGPILTRQWTVEIEVWHQDFDQLEALVDLFLATMHGLVTLFSAPDGAEETWRTGGATADGCVCRLYIFIKSPVLRIPAKTVTATPVITYTMDDTEVA